jgi:hypothetical protein
MTVGESQDDVRRMLEDDAALDASIRAALAETIIRHRRHDVPLAVWRDGRVQHVSADDVALPALHMMLERP